MMTQYATDENLAISAKSDWPLLSDPLERLAYGLDGATSADPWLFSSSSNDFTAQQIVSGHIIRLPERGKTKPANAARGLYAVDFVISATQLHLRPLGKPVGSGWPPQPPNTGSLEFAIDSADAQILQASEEIDLWLRTDPAAPASYPSDIITVADYRRMAVWLGLSLLYLGAAREGDPSRDTFLMKSRENRKFATDYFAALMARIIAIFATRQAPQAGLLTADMGEAFAVRGSQPYVRNKDGTLTWPQPVWGGWGWPIR